MANRLVKLVPDVPVEIALSSTDGINVVSPRGTPAVRYNLVDGRTFFATNYVAAKFKKLRIGPFERIALCMRNIDGKNITLVERVPTAKPEQDASTAGNGGVDPQTSDTLPQEISQEDPCATPLASDRISEDGASPEFLSELTLATPKVEELPPSQLERALKTAIFAAHSAEQYGKDIGYVVRFDQESVKCMAVTVLIGMQGGRN
jgi:hypothetical protein